MPSKLKKAIGAVKDQTSISLAKLNNSSHLQVAVVKATTHDDVPIDERYVCQVLHLVSSNKTHAAACVRAIGKRISRTRNWIVAIKSLMLVLRIFQDGDPYFPREVLHAMERGAKILNLSSFRDDSHSNPWDHAAFVRTFALYLDERLDCFLTGKLQRRYAQKQRDGSPSFINKTSESIRDMKLSTLLDRIVYWQRLLGRAIATRPTGAAKTSQLIQTSLHAIVTESFDLYQDISDGLALLLDSFFHMQYELCACAFQVCIKAGKQFEELTAFYSLCKAIGVGRTSEYPSVQAISEELIETLQAFLEDQSSFPANSTTSNKPLLLPCLRAGSPTSRGDDGQTQPKGSEFCTKCTSLEKNSQQEEPNAGSTRPLAMTNSMDLLSLDDGQTEVEQQRDRQEHEKKQNPLESILLLNDLTNAQQSTSRKGLLPFSSGKGWELILAERGLNGFVNPQAHTTFERKGSMSREGRGLVLAGTHSERQTDQGISSNTFDASTAIALYDQSQSQHQPPLSSLTITTHF